MIAEYANLFVLQEYVTFARGVDRFKKDLPALRKIYETCRHVKRHVPEKMLRCSALKLFQRQR